VEKNGKFYLYVPVISKLNNRGAIGVAVGDSPLGPFYDPLGRPLVQSEWGDIDPTIFIDEDGTAHMYWGNPKLKYVQLNEDMISYTGQIIEVPMTEEAFGKRNDNPERPTKYEEGRGCISVKSCIICFGQAGRFPSLLVIPPVKA
jgi:arabinoxylan arabinofuranohydrolase